MLLAYGLTYWIWDFALMQLWDLLVSVSISLSAHIIRFATRTHISVSDLIDCCSGPPGTMLTCAHLSLSMQMLLKPIQPPLLLPLNSCAKNSIRIVRSRAYKTCG